MDLLSLLTGSLTSNSSLNSLSQVTGQSTQTNQSVLSSALPTLLQAMTSNASTNDGASSLLNALTQHQTTAPVSQQITTNDKTDGAKILQHILGDNMTSTINAIAKKTGTSAKDVKNILSVAAPSILSALSSATTAASQQVASKPASSGVNLADGIDLSDVMGLLGGLNSSSNSKPASSNNNLGALGSLASTLLGGSTGNSKPASSSNNGSALLTSLLTSMLK